MEREPETRIVISVRDSLRARVAAFQIAEIARIQKPVSQAEVLRRALTVGMDVLERESHLDDI